MLDASHGWALTSKAVLKTQDGGQHWQILKALPQVDAGPYATFMNATYGWVGVHILNTNPTTYTMLRTSDRGASWHTSTLQDTALTGGYVDSPYFINPQEGWTDVVRVDDVYLTTMDIFHTSDGGQTWQKIGGTTVPSSHLSIKGYKTGIACKDTQTAWVGVIDNTPNAFLYATSDGGQTWHTQPLPIPDELKNGRPIEGFGTNPPVFFGQRRKNGVLPVNIAYEGEGYLDLYVTSDGGNTWTPTKLANIDGLDIYVLDRQHIWTTHTFKGTIYRTNDVGQHWTQLVTPPGSIGGINFIDANTGWAISIIATKKPFLLHTTDGGSTWQQIPYVLPAS